MTKRVFLFLFSFLNCSYVLIEKIKYGQAQDDGGNVDDTCNIGTEGEGASNDFDYLNDPDPNGNFPDYGNNPQKDSRAPVIVDPPLLWPDGLVHYSMSSFFSACEKSMIYYAMSMVVKQSCIRFRKYDPESNNKSSELRQFVRIDKVYGWPRNCFSTLGYRPPHETRHLYLGKDCFKTIGYILHHLFHVLGLFHTNNRMDRDKYITIDWDNIKSAYFYKFNVMYNHSSDLFPQLQYDFSSLMHLPRHAYAKDRSNPLKGLSMNFADPGIVESNSIQCFGQRWNATVCDFVLLRKMYTCPLKSDLKFVVCNPAANSRGTKKKPCDRLYADLDMWFA